MYSGLAMRPRTVNAIGDLFTLMVTVSPVLM